MKYGERLRAARKHKKLTQDDLAKLAGVTQMSISKIERGDQETSTFDIELAHALDIEPLWLKTGNYRHAPDWLTGRKPTINENRPLYAINNSALVPLISYVQAGAWCGVIDNYAPGDAELWMPCPTPHSQYTYALRVRGDSMTNPYPGTKSYPDGSIIYVDPEKQLTNGCRVVAKLIDVDEVTFKEYREDAGKRLLKPLNPQYPIQEITDNVLICGVIIGQYIAE